MSFSSSMSSTIKSTGNMNLSILTRTSSITYLGCFKEWSTSCNVIIVGRVSPNPGFLKIDRGIKLILTTRSHNALLNATFPIQYRIVKLFGSMSLGGNFLCRIALLFRKCDYLIIPELSLIWENFFINFTWLGICSRALTNGILMWNFINTSKNLANC